MRRLFLLLLPSISLSLSSVCFVTAAAAASSSSSSSSSSGAAATGTARITKATSTSTAGTASPSKATSTGTTPFGSSSSPSASSSLTLTSSSSWFRSFSRKGRIIRTARGEEPLCCYVTSPRRGRLDRSCHRHARANRIPSIRTTAAGASKRAATTTATRTMTMMVRNIDLPECLIFYGVESMMNDNADDENDDYSGLESLLQECEDVGTAVVVIDTSSSEERGEESVSENCPVPLPSFVQRYGASSDHVPPIPHDLYYGVMSGGVQVQPRSFGGSSGFGRQQYVEPVRPPLPSRCVVLTTAPEQILAARYLGMRCVHRKDDDGDDPITMLADAVVTGPIDFWLDDIATPGSFWLNPSHPRDEEGNRVDPDPELLVSDMIRRKERQQEQRQEQQERQQDIAEEEENDEVDDDEIQRILADMAPL